MEAAICDVCETNDFAVVRVERQGACAGDAWFPIVTCACRSCGHVFLSPRMGAAELSSFYATQMRESFDIPRGETIGLFQADVGVVTRELGEGGGRRALEVGCYTGYMLNRLRQAGWRVEGLEPNRGSAARARELFGIDVHECMFEDYRPSPERRVELIVMGSVLEHVQRPTQVLLHANAHLEVGGHIFVRVPDLEQLVVDTVAEMFPAEHPHSYSRPILHMLCEKTGFEALSLSTHAGIGRHLILVARKVTSTSAPLSFDRTNCFEEACSVIERYSALVDATRRRISKRLRPLLEEGQRIAVYGAGTHTEFLLRYTPLLDGALVGLVDSNPAKWGTSFCGLDVSSPDTLNSDLCDSVVISSQAFEEQIYERIRHLESSGVQIVRFYSPTP